MDQALEMTDSGQHPGKILPTTNWPFVGAGLLVAAFGGVFGTIRFFAR